MGGREGGGVVVKWRSGRGVMCNLEGRGKCKMELS